MGNCRREKSCHKIKQHGYIEEQTTIKWTSKELNSFLFIFPPYFEKKRLMKKNMIHKFDFEGKKEQGGYIGFSKSKNDI